MAWTAESINKKAANISKTATPINQATDAVLNLDRTNELAASILAPAQPLDAKLAEIVPVAKSLDALAASINASASEVDGTAKGINGDAGGIVTTARSIDRGVMQINTNLDRTIETTPPDGLGVQNIHQRVAFANGQGATGRFGANPNDLTAAVADARNIIARLTDTNKHVTSICRSPAVLGAKTC